VSSRADIPLLNKAVPGRRYGRCGRSVASRNGRHHTTDRFWLNLQSRYDLEVERGRLADTLDRIEPLATA
jgi:hypothetical protein